MKQANTYRNKTHVYISKQKLMSLSGGVTIKGGETMGVWGHLSGASETIVAQMRWCSRPAAGSGCRRLLGDYIPNMLPTRARSIWLDISDDVVRLSGGRYGISDRWLNFRC
ncbi:hypothetical protein OUZ56_032962 [Daphnia magna]|uniref:Uncharacterized protein n=1 Tax=Daphnia magna TaxID=35525 RepID=A0ABQ9ZXB5_9CRUS|nr:hypothetical protein OUZ56_032962 [Daphnia magna]